MPGISRHRTVRRRPARRQPPLAWLAFAAVLAGLWAPAVEAALNGQVRFAFFYLVVDKATI